jgi:hypothetical protein
LVEFCSERSPPPQHSQHRTAFLLACILIWISCERGAGARVGGLFFGESAGGRRKADDKRNYFLALRRVLARECFLLLSFFLSFFLFFLSNFLFSFFLNFLFFLSLFFFLSNFSFLFFLYQSTFSACLLGMITHFHCEYAFVEP